MAVIFISFLIPLSLAAKVQLHCWCCKLACIVFIATSWGPLHLNTIRTLVVMSVKSICIHLYIEDSIYRTPFVQRLVSHSHKSPTYNLYDVWYYEYWFHQDYPTYRRLATRYRATSCVFTTYSKIEVYLQWRLAPGYQKCRQQDCKCMPDTELQSLSQWCNCRIAAPNYHYQVSLIVGTTKKHTKYCWAWL